MDVLNLDVDVYKYSSFINSFEHEENIFFITNRLNEIPKIINDIKSLENFFDNYDYLMMELMPSKILNLCVQESIFLDTFKKYFYKNLYIKEHLLDVGLNFDIINDKIILQLIVCSHINVIPIFPICKHKPLDIVFYKNANLELFKFLYENNYTFTGDYIIYFIKLKSIKALDYCYENGDICFSYRRLVNYYSLLSNDIEILKLMYQNNILLFKHYYIKPICVNKCLNTIKFLDSVNVITYQFFSNCAAVYNFKEYFEEYYINSQNYELSIEVINTLLEINSIFFEMLYNNERFKTAIMSKSLDHKILLYCIKQKNYEMFKEIFEIKPQCFSWHVSHLLVEKNEYDLLCFCKEKIIFDAKLLNISFQLNNFKLIKFCVEHGCKNDYLQKSNNDFDYNCVMEHAGSLDLEILIYLHNQGFEFNENTLIKAFRSDKHENVCFLKDIGCPISKHCLFLSFHDSDHTIHDFIK